MIMIQCDPIGRFHSLRAYTTSIFRVEMCHTENAEYYIGESIQSDTWLREFQTGILKEKISSSQNW
jgi:hypothetical protein